MSENVKTRDGKNNSDTELQKVRIHRLGGKLLNFFRKRFWFKLSIYLLIAALLIGTIFVNNLTSYNSIMEETFAFEDLGFFITAMFKTEGPFTAQKKIYSSQIEVFGIAFYNVSRIGITIFCSDSYGSIVLNKSIMITEGESFRQTFIITDKSGSIYFLEYGENNVKMLLCLETSDGWKSRCSSIIPGDPPQSNEMRNTIFLESHDKHTSYIATKISAIGVVLGAIFSISAFGVKGFRDLYRDS